MGNLTGGGAGLGLGLLMGGPVGGIIGFAVGGGTGMAVEIANAESKGLKGDGGRHISVGSDIFDCKVLTLYIRKSDLCYAGFNTLSATGRFLLAPASTLAAENKSFWFEHRWIVLELDNGQYITTYKGLEGIIVKVFSSWDDANSKNNNGMNGHKNKWVNTVKQCSGNNRTVRELVEKINNTSSYYELNGNNCQDYAEELYDWI